MTRVEQVVATVFLAGFLLLLLLVALVNSTGMPNVVACVEPETASHTPAMSVEVASNRNGHIAERNLFGCTFYFYDPPPGR
jgi:hypothetical protein